MCSKYPRTLLSFPPPIKLRGIKIIISALEKRITNKHVSIHIMKFISVTHKEVIKHGILCLVFRSSLPQVSQHPVQVEAVHHVGDVLAGGVEAQWRPMGVEAPGVEILSAGGDQPPDPADLGLVQQTLVPGQTRQT